MNCYSEQSCAVFADGEMAAAEARRLQEHLEGCAHCRELVERLRVENSMLAESLHEMAEAPAVAPAFSGLRSSWRSRGAWLQVIGVTAVLALSAMVYTGLEGLGAPAALDWLNPLSLGGRVNLVFSLCAYLSGYFTQGGTAMLSNYAALVCWISLLLLLLGSSALLRGRRWRLPHPGLRLIVILLTLSLPGFALERRNGGLVAVGVNETVDDTLLATGDTVRVDGVVNGDVLAFGRAVEVSGTVKGDLLSWAQRVTVTGTVEGRIYSFAQTFDLTGQVDHSLYGAAQTLELDSRGRVGEGILAAASDASIDGRVQRGVWLGAGGAEVSGDIGRELAVAGGTLTLASTARVGGDLWARVRQLKDVHIAEGATIAGKRDIQQTAELTVRQSRYRSFGFYLWQALWVAAAMLVGWLALALFPGFVRGSTQAVASGWRSLGLGLGVLAGVPLAILVIAITVVGIPISLIGLAVYLVALYLAKIWVAAFLGRLILKPAEPGNRDWLLGLLLGLLILTAGGFIPFLGGLVRFVVLCLGLGAFAWQVYRTIKQPAVA